MLFTISIFLATISGATLPNFASLVPHENVSLRVLEVQTLSELVERNLLSKPANDILFFVSETNTYVAPKDENYWDVEVDLDDIDDSLNRRNGKNLAVWIEFGFEKTYIASSDDKIPVSRCHSETNGQGGALNIQSSVGASRSLTGSFGVKPNTVTVSLTLTGTVSLERPENINTVIACSAKPGDVVQLFLLKTKFLYFTPKFRLLEFNRKSRTLKEPGDFIEQRQQRAVIKGGVGEWLCATASMIPLQCADQVSDITIFGQPT